MKPQYSFFLVLLLMVVGGILVMSGKPTDTANLSGVMEVVGDAQRSVTKPAMLVTRISPEEEIQLGRQLAARISWSATRQMETRELERYLGTVGNQIALQATRKGIPYQFHLLEHGIINAFALPGGQIFVYRGLIEFVESEAELAAILGHEITHVDARHCVELFQAEIAARKLTQPILGIGARLFEFGAMFISRVVSQGYRKNQEFQADLQGLQMLVEAGYDPLGAENVMKRMSDKFGGEAPPPKAMDPVQEITQAVVVAAGSYFHSHPPVLERVQRLVEARKAMNLEGREFYCGRENLKQRKARPGNRFSQEVVRF